MNCAFCWRLEAKKQTKKQNSGQVINVMEKSKARLV